MAVTVKPQSRRKPAAPTETFDTRSYLEIAQNYALPGLPISVRIEGALPGLLMHSGQAQELMEKAKLEHAAAGNRSKFIPTPEREALWGAYIRDDDRLYLPVTNVHRCLVESAKAFKIEKSRANMRTVVAGGVTFPLDVSLGFDLLDPETNEPITDYVVDMARVVVQKASIKRARPLIARWAAELRFLIDADSVRPEVFAQILGHAGLRIGVGDFRPEKGGQYGRFIVTKLDVVEP